MLYLDHDSLVQSVGRILGSLFPGSLFSSHTWDIWTFEGHSELSVSNGYGVRDPQFETLQIEGMRTDCTANPQTLNLDLRGFESSRFSCRGGGLPERIALLNKL